MNGSVNLVVEDILSEVVLRKVFSETAPEVLVSGVFGKCGSGYIKDKISGFNRSSRGLTFFVLTDLDQYDCPVSLMQDWLRFKVEPGLIFRVAVREVEAWLLADRAGLAGYLMVSESCIPEDAEAVQKPKELLINVARRSRIRSLREALVPAENSTARQGPDYNGSLIQFVHDKWCLKTASKRSESLRRAVLSIKKIRNG